MAVQFVFFLRVIYFSFGTSLMLSVCVVEQNGFQADERLQVSPATLLGKLQEELGHWDTGWSAQSLSVQDFLHFLSGALPAGELKCEAVLAVGDCAVCGLLQSWTEPLSLPFACVGPRPCYSPPRQISYTASSLHPALAALADVAMFLGWRELFLIFDDTLDDSSLTYLVTEVSHDFIMFVMRRIASKTNASYEIRQHLKVAQSFSLENVIVFARESVVHSVIAQAVDMGMLGGDHTWLVYTEGTMTWERVDAMLDSVLYLQPHPPVPPSSCSDSVSSLPPQSPENIQSPVSPASCCNQVACTAALQSFQERVERAIGIVVQGALSQLLQSTNTTGAEANATWKRTVEDSDDSAVDVCRVVRHRDGRLQSTVVASWTSKSRLQVLVTPMAKEGFKDFGHTTITVAALESLPFVIKRTVNNSAVYEGFCIDVLNELASTMKFSYVVQEPEDQKFGALDNGVWNGMVSMVMKGEATLGVGPFSLTPEREEVIDFSTPFMEDGASILTRKASSENVQLFQTFSPFSVNVWLALLGAALTVSLCISGIARLSPFAARSSDGRPPVQRSFANTFWLVYSSFVSQGGDSHPRSVSGRSVLGFWWLFTILMASTYTANLAAFLTVAIARKPINSLAELVTQTDIKPFLQTGTNLETLFQEATGGTYRRLWEQMDTGLFILSIDEVLSRLQDGGYAFISDRSELEYIVLTDCKTYALADETFNTAGLGFIMPEHAPFADAMNRALLKMQEAGLVSHWRQKWWPRSDECSAGQPSSQAQVLGLRNLGGPFLLQAAVTLAAALAAILARALTRFRAKVRRSQGHSVAGLARGGGDDKQGDEGDRSPRIDSELTKANLDEA